MEQVEVVRKFVDSLGKFDPPKITAKVARAYIENIVVDSESLEEFICYSDKYVKHTQTFQLSFLLHSLASVLKIAHLGAVSEVVRSIQTDAFDISADESRELGESDAAARYDELCSKLMDYENEEAQKLHKRFIEGRNSGDKKLDDGTEPNKIFDPMKTKFDDGSPPGDDLTEESEHKI